MGSAGETPHALRAPEAARRLCIPTKEVLRLLHAHELRTVTIDGIAHIPDDAVDEFAQES